MNHLNGLINPHRKSLLNLNDRKEFMALMNILERPSDSRVSDEDWYKTILNCIEEKNIEDIGIDEMKQVGEGTYGKVYLFKDRKQAKVLKLLKFNEEDDEEENQSTGKTDGVSYSRSLSSFHHQSTARLSLASSAASSHASRSPSSKVEECQFLSNVLKETLIQYILCNIFREDFFYTRLKVGDKVYKSLAPIIYEIFYCSTEEGIEFGIIMEALDGDVHDLANSEHFIEPHHGVGNSFKFLADISADLYYAQKLVGFSHRDLKLDNIMYKQKSVGSKRNLYYLIDFGFSCLSFDGGLPCYDGKCGKHWGAPISINCLGLNEFEDSICHMPDRDLTQLSFNIWDNYQYTYPAEIISFCSERISKILIIGIASGKLSSPVLAAKRRTQAKNAREGQHDNMLYESLRAGITKSALSEVGFSGWGLLYPFLNEPNTQIDNPLCNPVQFSTDLLHFDENPGKIYMKFLERMLEDPIVQRGGSKKSRKRFNKKKYIKKRYSNKLRNGTRNKNIQ